MTAGNPGSYTRRKHSHDYRAPGVYHIILRKSAEIPLFGVVAGTARIPFGQPGSARIERSPLGEALHRAVFEFPDIYPEIRIFQHCVMPDHLHILLRVTVRTKDHLGAYIARFMRLAAKRAVADGVPAVTSAGGIFERGYTDRPIYSHRNLDVWFNYIRQNPHRLAMRRQFPEFFTRRRNLNLCGQEMEGYGNLFLLRNPDKAAVAIRSHWTEETTSALERGWLEDSAEGVVLISPFISPKEKAIREKAEEAGGCIIIITEKPFGERFKPAAHDFAQCEKGKLLILAPAKPWPLPRFRMVCQHMNRLAAAIAAGSAAPMP